MNIQDFLGLPLEVGQNFFERQGKQVKVLKTIPNNNSNVSFDEHLKDPYILRIRETDINCIELLISFF
ncbi:hypothetical protein NSA47_03835 [Irregularibacter muris]|uniref:Uncharacterized protein n=1 Tax=Irregularibacter muris TaxID=1796619 RepID=A0AAE3HEP2_9FIRM|nr:hypothetical protein [Irregularibacter muris]MCR1898117.1 hypothetical protein [Irregularibacter muris]